MVAAPVPVRARRFPSLGLGLPAPVWVFQAGQTLNFFGTGLVMPFVVIWLHDVRGVSLAVAGATLAAFGALSVLVVPLAGTLLDRLGGRRTLTASLVLLTAGYALLPACRSAWEAAAALGIAGLGNGAFHPATSTVLVALTPEEKRHTAFSLGRAGGNLGVGLGGLAAGLFVAAHAARAFTLLFLGDALTFALFALVVAALPVAVPAAKTGSAAAGGWRAVLRDRPFLVLVGFNALMATVGFCQLEAILPIFSTQVAGVSAATVGALFAVNVAAVVVLQIPISRFLEGKRRMPALAACSAVWALAWLVAAAGGVAVARPVAAELVLLAAAIVAVGECLQASVSGPLTADLAPAELRGRYFALNVAGWGIGFAAGPPLSGDLLSFSPLALWLVLAALCLAAGAGALAVERLLPAAVRRTPSTAKGG